ncbi:MAG: N-acyl-D-aspartate/D-glutamate deacylase, partial [Verrucomicrobia bacterium]|nr:N-acyl-D-aspartate/D-glutamate deacylase [Verrucomicrobiota bacterium]
AKATAWLRAYPADSTEESAMQILGLRWAGRPKSELKKFAVSLKAAQRQDGGWAQIATLESDAYATGLALHALYRAGALAVSEPAYQAGVKFLLKTQLEDGSWFVPTRASPVQVAIDGIFPHEKNQWMSSMATGWASISLMYASGPGAMEVPVRN